jgi:Acetyltransferase (GNAT) domain
VHLSPVWAEDVLLPLPQQGELKVVVTRTFPTLEIEDGWRDLLGRVELPSHYTAPEFFREEHLRPRRPFAVLAIQRGTAVGVLTGMHGPNRTVSGLPSRAQICLDHPGNEEAMLALMTGLLAEAGPFDLIEIHSWTPLVSAEKLGFRVQNVDGPVVLDLTQPVEELFKQLNSKRRNNIRYAIKNGLEFAEVTRAEEFSAYYRDVYSLWRGTSRKQIHEAEATFEGFERRFRLNGNRKLFVAKAGGKTVAGAFLRFYPGGLVEYAANSSLDEYLRLKPNEFIQWRAIEWAQGQGFRAYSLGGAGQFHREFGGTVVPEYHYWFDAVKVAAPRKPMAILRKRAN